MNILFHQNQEITINNIYLLLQCGDCLLWLDRPLTLDFCLAFSREKVSQLFSGGSQSDNKFSRERIFSRSSSTIQIVPVPYTRNHGKEGEGLKQKEPGILRRGIYSSAISIPLNKSPSPVTFLVPRQLQEQVSTTSSTVVLRLYTTAPPLENATE